MRDLVVLLPEIILYIVLGFIFTRTYKFTRIINNITEYQHVFIVSLIVGFILWNIYSLIPISFGIYVDTIGMVVGSVIMGFISAKIINSNKLHKLFQKLKISQTVNQKIWADIEDKDNAIFVSIEDKTNHVLTDGMLVLYESFERQPLIQLSAFRQFQNGEIINDFSNNPERTILIDTSKYENVVITYNPDSEKCKRELWVVFYLQSNKIAFEYQSVIF